MNADRELSYREFILRENHDFHTPLGQEYAFYVAVKNGEVNRVSQLCKYEFSNLNGLGKLSDSPLQNMKFHFVVAAALFSRYCIEGGMEHEAAYSLSDVYIQKADKCASIAQISQLHAAMSMDYARRMKNLLKNRVYSKQIVKCIEYIYDNLHTRILISELAQHTGLNPSYLSRLFRNETGISVTEYIQIKKIETAKNMLKYSDYLPSQIATILAFPNQSYFIEVFKKRVGMTPKRYQNMCFREIGINTGTPLL
ncbi:MAG TPA: AraC family transcriptional regulator [Clostridia bacterium]|nr:AraC family transcriptional regulator [Clostridia bacterium]